MLRLVFLLCFISSVFMANAQYTLGLKGGYTRAWEAYGDVGLPEDAEIQVDGLNLSLLAYRNVGKFFTVGVEPGFIERGAACIPGFQPIFEGDTKFLLKYTELPVFFGATVPVFNTGFDISAKAGYNVAYLQTAYQEVTNFQDNTTTRTKMGLKNSEILRRWDHGLKAGAKISRSFGKSQLFLGTDYFHGLIDAEKSNTSQNRSIEFYLGYSFLLNVIRD